MEQEKKKGKKKGLVILIILLLLLVGVSGTLLLVQQGVFQPKTEISNDISDAEKTLRERLAAEGSETIEITEDIEIYGGPLIVNGNKKLVGEGALIAVEGFEDGALLHVSDGAKLQVEEVELNANLMAAYVVYVVKNAEASIGSGVNIGDAAESNVYNEGTLTMSGGRIRKGEVGITNKGTAVIEDGIVALMNRYLVDNLTEGTLEIKGGSFSSSEGYGIYNRGTMTVVNAEISANKLMGICNLGKADVKDSVVSMNAYHNIINKSRATLTIKNTEIVSSSQSGIHNEEDAYAVVTSCKFNTNTLGNVHNRGEIEISKCVFEDVAYSSVISDGKVATTYIEDTTISNTTSTGHGLLSTNGCKVELKDVAFVNVEGRAIHNKGGYVTGKKVTVDGTGKVAIGNNAYETGSYGSIKLKNVDVKTPFVAIINDCDGIMEIEDGKLTSTKQTTVRIASGTMTLEDVAITGAKADGETKFYGVYANGGTLNIKDCSIKNTSSRGIQNYATMMNIDGLTIENTGAAAMGTIAAKEGLQPSTIIANDLTITNAGTNSICNAGPTSKIVVTNSVINPAGGNSIKVYEGVMTMENTKIYGSQKEECVGVLVDKDGTLYLKKGIYITNEKGRGVSNSGILFMENTTVENCKTTSHGGAIFNNGQLTVKDSVLYKNVAGANGGAIHATAVSTMKLTNVEMSNNAATGQGGAINLPSGSAETESGSIELENVTIQNNKAENYSSGAIYVGRYRQLAVEGKETVISRNTSGTYGGAIGMGDYAVVTMTDGTISDNEALNKNGGGAILLKPYADLTLDGVTISGNTSTANGGAIYLDTNAKLSITGGSLKDNFADGNGGAIHATVASTTTLNKVEVSGNTATGQGGAINLPSGAENITDSLMTLKDVTITENEAKNYSSGAIYVGRYRQLELNGKKTEISGNVAGTYGGAIGLGEYASVSMTDGTISNNKAKGSEGGGAIYLKPSAELALNEVTVSKNTVNAHGGAIYLSADAKLNMAGGKLSDNEANASGDTNKNGGAIHAIATSELNLSNVELSNNTATGQGGAINLPAGSAENSSNLVKLTNVTITNNTAKNYSSGAIYVGNYRQLEIDGEDNVISKNTAGTYGGAIGAGDYAKVAISKGTISNNEAKGSEGGGAIFLKPNAELTVAETTLSENISYGHGGAVYLSGVTTFNMIGGVLSGNEAKASGEAYKNGGAVHVDGTAKMVLSGVELNGNTASGQGGAINLPGTEAEASLVQLTNVTISENEATNYSSGAIYVGKNRQIKIDGTSTEISGNTAGTYGGAIGAGENASIEVNNAVISKNTAITNGGAICLNGTATLTVTGGAIENNKASTAKGNGGGAIFAAVNSKLSVDSAKVSGNNAYQGGAIYLYCPSDYTSGTGGLELDNVTIYNNTATNSGGAVYVGKYWDVDVDGSKTEISENIAATNGGAFITGQGSELTLNAGTLKKNKAGHASEGGGAIFLWETAFEMNGGTISENEATKAHGGAIYGGGASTITINAGTISGNTAKQNGGAIYLGEATTLTMTGGALQYNKTTVANSGNNGGGAIYASINSTLDLSNATISENTSGRRGGAIYLVPDSNAVDTNSLKIKNVTMEKNETTDSGGAVYVGSYWEVSIDGADTLISGNTAKQNGGAFLTGASSKLTFNAGKVEKNKASNATEGGGAIYLWATIFEMNGGTISENEATKAHGGAVYGGGASTITINAGTISGNTAKQNGGAIYTTDSTPSITIAAGTISGNTAETGNGGAIYLGKAVTLTMTGGTLENNKTTVANSGNNGGGAIYASINSTLDLSNATISGNTSGRRGGAIYLVPDSNATDTNSLQIENVTIKDNETTDSGGAIYVGSFWEVYINGANTLISGNTAKKNGGAFVTGASSKITMNAGTISDNEARNASEGGGAIYLWDTEFEMNGGTISANTATCNGGGIYLNGTSAGTSVITMTGGSISENKVGNQLNNVYIYNGTVKLDENANLQSVYFVKKNTPIQVTGSTLNNPVTVTCATANQADTLVVKKAEGSTANLRQLCEGENKKIITGAGFDNNDYALIETEQGMAWKEVTKVTTFGELESAIENTNNATKYIKVSTPLNVNATISVQNNANIILIGDATLTRASGFTGEFFNVASGSTLTLEGATKDNKLILDGANITALKPFIQCSGGTLNINEGVELRNNKNGANSTTKIYGGAIYASANTTLNLNNMEISGNTSAQGGAICLPHATNTNTGSLTLINVKIQNNISNSSAGAVYLGKYWKLTINEEGEGTTLISGNTANTNGGAIVTGEGSVVTMKAGTIRENTANSGDGAGGVYCWGPSIFDMSGGVIKDNTDNSGKGAPNVRAMCAVTIKLSGTAELASICWQTSGKYTTATPIQVTAPLTAENVNTIITLPSYNAGTTVVSYTGTTETDMSALTTKFSLANTTYKLNVSDKNLVVAE